MGYTKVDESQLQKIKKILTKLGKDDMRKFFQLVGQRLVADFRMGFRMSIAPDGTPWAPITHREGKPLVDTGRLRSSIKAVVGNKTLEVGTNLKYAQTHQYGDTSTVQVAEHTKIINQAFGKKLKTGVYVNVSSHSKQRNIKARPFLGVEARQKKKIVAAFQQHIGALTNGKAKPI